jgi:outer membrane protein assembly factor BamB
MFDLLFGMLLSGNHTTSLDRVLIVMFIKSIHAALVLFCVAGHAFGEDQSNWLNWRGPLGNGSTEHGSYPAKFDAKNYLWRAELPGKGCSTPIVLNQKIFLTAPVGDTDAVLCFDFDGAKKWQSVFGKENAGKHRNGSGSNASPTTDGTAVFAYFKSGTLAAVELNGTVRWQTNLVERFGKDTLFWDHGTSPVLSEKHVIMARMHAGESWLAAFDKTSGELAWKVARNYTTPMECDHGYTTPLVIQHNEKEAILVWGAEHITIHDSTDGKLLWSCGNFNPEASKLWPAIATPVIVKDMAVIAYGRNDRGIPRLHGIRITGDGDVTKTNHIWKREDIGTFVPTPVVYKGHVILLRDRGEVECIDPATGKTLWSDSFPKGRALFYASPLIAGDTLYAPREDGVVFVASVANNKFEFLSENDMAEPVIGSPVPSANRIFLRGENHLFCIGSPSTQK